MSLLLPAQFLTPSFDILGYHSSLWRYRNRIMKNGRKLNSLLYHVPFYSGFFPCSCLPYVYVSSCTGFPETKKKIQKPNKKKNPNVFCQYCCGNTVYRRERNKNNAGKGIYWQRNLPELNQTFLLFQKKTRFTCKTASSPAYVYGIQNQNVLRTNRGHFFLCSYFSLTEKMPTTF